MLAAILIIIGLILDLKEKAHLFKRPITIARYFVIGLLFASAGISMYKDIVDGIQHDKDSNTITSLNIRDSVLSSQVDTLRKENKLAQKGYDDSIKSYHNYTTELLARYGLKVDTLTNTVNKFDTSVQKEIPPTLTIIDGVHFDSVNKEKRLSFILTSLNADAHLLDYYYIILNVKGVDKKGATIFDGNPIPFPGSSNFTTVIPAGMGHPLSFFIDRMKSMANVRDTFLLAMEFFYKSKSNKRQTPLRKVYIVFYSQKNTKEADNFVFMDAANYLRKNKIWTKFYDL